MDVFSKVVNDAAEFVSANLDNADALATMEASTAAMRTNRYGEDLAFLDWTGCLAEVIVTAYCRHHLAAVRLAEDDPKEAARLNEMGQEFLLHLADLVALGAKFAAAAPHTQKENAVDVASEAVGWILHSMNETNSLPELMAGAANYVSEKASDPDALAEIEAAAETLRAGCHLKPTGNFEEAAKQLVVTMTAVYTTHHLSGMKLAANDIEGATKLNETGQVLLARVATLLDYAMSLGVKHVMAEAQLDKTRH